MNAMKQYARVVNFQAVDVVPETSNGYNLPDRYHSALLAEFQEVPAQVKPGWYFWDGEWQAEKPAALQEEPTHY